MLLRFVGADLLGAAGPAAQVPSRVGDELEAVLGETHPNGTAVNSDVGGELDDTLPTDAFDGTSALDALANTGSVVVVIALVLVGLIGFCLYRRRRNRRRAKGPILGHSRTASGRGVALPRAEDEGPHEMDDLVGGGETGESSEERDDRDEKRLRGAEEIFNVGSDDEEDDGGRSKGKSPV